MSALDELITAFEYNWPTIKENFINEFEPALKYWYVIPIVIIGIFLISKIGYLFNKIEELLIKPRKKHKRKDNENRP